MKRFLTAFAVLFALAVPVQSSESPVILTVTGNGMDQPVQFNRDDLNAIASRAATLETPWTEGRITFEGPLLREVLRAAKADGGKVVLKALNDYSAEIPMEDATSLDTILALTMDGKPMSVRDKGPIFLIYPFDTNPELYNEKYFARSVWQIHEIEVRN